MAELHHRIEGQGPPLVLSHALGLDLGMWDAVAARLAPAFTVLRYDHRSHGRSAQSPGPWSVEDLADDAAGLIQKVFGDTPVAFAGLSLGGMTGQALAARHPGRVSRLVVVNSSSWYPDRAPWAQRVATVRRDGIAPLADAVVGRWLSEAFAATPAGRAAAETLRATLLRNAPQAYADACEAVASIDFRASNRRIGVPTLVVAGARDLATPPAMSEAIAAAIPGAVLATVDAAHISAVESPDALADAIAAFLA